MPKIAELLAMKRRVLWRENYTSIKLPRFRKKNASSRGDGAASAGGSSGRNRRQPVCGGTVELRGGGTCLHGQARLTPASRPQGVGAGPRGGPRAWPRSGGSTGGRRGSFLPAPETRRLAHPASRELSTRLPVSPLEFLEQKYLLNPLSKCQTGKNKKEKAKEGVSPATKSASFATP